MGSQATKKNKKKYKESLNADLSIGLSKEQIKLATQRVLTDFNTDKGDRAAWEEEQTAILNDWKLYKEAKNKPWPGCSNVALPITAVAVNQFHARGYDAFFSSKELISAEPTTATIDEIFKDTLREMKEALEMQAAIAAERGEEMPSMNIPQLRRMVLEESIKRGNEYSSAVGRFLSKEVRDNMTEYEEETDTMLLWLAISGTTFKKTTWDKKNERAKSIFTPANKIYLPFQDDREHPSHYIHRYSMTYNEILQGIAQEEYRDIKDKLTQSMTTEENKNSIDEAAQRNVPTQTNLLEGNQGLRDILEYHGYFDIDGDGIEEPVIFLVDFQSEQLLRAYVRTKDAKPKGEEIHHFTKFVLIPNPGNAYGIGFGTFLRNIKAIIETLFNQTIDNLTLTNVPWGFLDKNSAILDAGDIEIYPGKFNEVSANDKPLASMIYIPRFQPTNPLIMNMIDWLYSLARELGSVSEIMTGQTSKVEAATAVLVKIEQGTKVFSVIMKRIIRRASAEIQKIYIMNQIYRKKNELLYWMPPDFSKFFKMKFKVALNVDPTNMNRLEKLKKAEIIYETGMANPLIMNDPMKLWFLTRNYYEAIGLDSDKMNRILGDTPPEPPKQNIEDVDQVTELSNLIRGEEMHALADQDHLKHIQVLDDFRKSMHFSSLDKFRKNALEQHLRNHQAFLYMHQEADKELAKGGI